MEVSTEICADDHQAFTRHVWYSGARGTWVWFVLIAFATMSLSVVLEYKAGLRLDTSTMLLTMIVLTGYLALAQRRLRPDPEGPSLGNRTFTISREGFCERSRHFELLTRWSGVRSVEENRNYLFVFIDTCQAHIVPKRAFASDEDARRFADELRRRIADPAVSTALVVQPTTAS